MKPPANTFSQFKRSFLEDTRTEQTVADRFPVAGARETLRQLRILMRGRGLMLWATVAVLIAAAWCGVLVPRYMGQVVDVVDDHGTTGDLWVLAGKMIAAVIIGAILSAIGFVMAARLAEQAIAEIREDMVSTTLGLPVERVEKAGTGDVVSRGTDDVAQISEAVTSILPIAAGAFFTVLVSIVGVGTVNPWFMLAFLFVFPVQYLAVRSYLKYAPAVYAAERAAMAERARMLLTTIQGLPAVRAFRLEMQRRLGISEWSWKVVRHGVDVRITSNMIMARMHFAEFLGMAVTLVIGFYLVQAGLTTVGGATAAMLLFMRLFGPMTRMIMSMDIAQSGVTSLMRIVGVLKEKPQPPGEVNPDPGAGVVLDDVSFSYGRGSAVEDVSLRIEPGQTVALVGASGAGKSTLAAIIAGLRVADSGTVHVAGADMTEETEGARGKAVALVTQEVYVFDGSLREDLTLAKQDASEEDIQAAMQRVGAADWVARLKHGLDTQVGHGGHRLNPVEAQQVALARLLLSDPPVVVLDEATAEAGSSGTGELARAAEEVVKGRTALVVAHRLDQASQCDRVIVMDAGRIVENGTHEELVGAGGRYANLWSAWSRGRS